MEAILASSKKGSFTKIKSAVERPAPLTAAVAKRLVAATA